MLEGLEDKVRRILPENRRKIQSIDNTREKNCLRDQTRWSRKKENRESGEKVVVKETT